LKKHVWITWENQERNLGVSKAVDAELFVVDYDKYGSIPRFVFSTFSTLGIIRRGTYQKIFAQSPSLVLAFILTVIKKLTLVKSEIILDLHNSSIEALDSKNIIKKFLSRFSAKNADFLIVTNTGLEKALNPYNKNLLIIPDSLPDFDVTKKTKKEHATQILVVASYAPDEPLNEILSAIEKLPFEVKAYVTGKKKKAGPLLTFESEKISFTDYLSKEDYHGLLCGSDVVIDLTTRDNCLVCGAYEAITAEVPAILSDSVANREIFTKGMLFTKNNSKAIGETLIEFDKKRESLKKEIVTFKSEFQKNWDLLFNKAKEKLEQH